MVTWEDLTDEEARRITVSQIKIHVEKAVNEWDRRYAKGERASGRMQELLDIMFHRDLTGLVKGR